MKSSIRATALLAASVAAMLVLAPVHADPASPATKPAAKPVSSSGGTTRPPASKSTASHPRASAARLDGIAAMVNGEAVLQSDVEEQLNLMMSRSQGAPPDPATQDTLRHQILDQLIDEKLIVAEAKRQAVTVSDVEVAREIDKAIKDVRTRLGSEDAFQAQLRQEGLTEDKLRERYKGEITRQQLAQRLVQKQLPRPSVTQAEAEDYFKLHKEKFPKVPPEVSLSVIQIPATPDSAALEIGRQKVLAARQRIEAGEKFAKVAAEVSDDQGSAHSGGDLGFFTRGSMEPAVEDAAFSLKLNQVSPPVRSSYGWHLVEPIERDTVKATSGKDSLDASGKPVLEAHARHILIKVPLTQEDADRARALAQRVHAEAVKGTNFGTLARRYSKYEGKQTEDGDIGSVSMAALQPNIRAGIDSLEVGQISDVLVNPVGFNIFKVTDRKPEREYTLEEVKNQLRDAVTEMKFRERYDEWVKGLRARSKIEIHAS